MDILIDELGPHATPEIRQDMDIIITQVARIRTIIEDLLKLAKQDPSTVQLQSFHINPIVQNTQALVQHELARRHITLVQDLRATQPVLADAAQLQQVLINMIMNAAHAIQADGQIILRTRDSRRGGLYLVVRDNGCGIPNAQLQRIFDPFYTTSDHGTGLGLAISHRLLSQAQATIKVRSSVGQGTVFLIAFKSGHNDPVNT